MPKKTPRIEVTDPGEAEILAQLEALADRRAQFGFEIPSAMAVAACTRALTSLRAERRQERKSDRRELASFPDSQVVEYLRSLSATRKENLCREVLDADRDEGLL